MKNIIHLRTRVNGCHLFFYAPRDAADMKDRPIIATTVPAYLLSATEAKGLLDYVNGQLCRIEDRSDEARIDTASNLLSGALFILRIKENFDLPTAKQAGGASSSLPPGVSTYFEEDYQITSTEIGDVRHSITQLRNSYLGFPPTIAAILSDIHHRYSPAFRETMLAGLSAVAWFAYDAQLLVTTNKNGSMRMEVLTWQFIPDIPTPPPNDDFDRRVVREYNAATQNSYVKRIQLYNDGWVGEAQDEASGNAKVDALITDMEAGDDKRLAFWDYLHSKHRSYMRQDAYLKYTKPDSVVIGHGEVDSSIRL